MCEQWFDGIIGIRSPFVRLLDQLLSVSIIHMQVSVGLLVTICTDHSVLFGTWNEQKINVNQTHKHFKKPV